MIVKNLGATCNTFVVPLTMGDWGKLPLSPLPLADLDEAPKLVRFLTSSVVVSHKRVENIPILYEYVLDKTVQMGCLGALTNQASPSCPSQSALKGLDL